MKEHEIMLGKDETLKIIIPNFGLLLSLTSSGGQWGIASTDHIATTTTIPADAKPVLAFSVRRVEPVTGDDDDTPDEFPSRLG
jgi:hypothetical protein